MDLHDIPPTLFDPSFKLIPEPDPPAEASRLAMISRTPAERAQFVIDLTIFTDELEQIVASIEAMMQRAERISAPGGFHIVGDGGAGKTFIKSRVLKLYPPRHSKLRSFVPAVAIQLEETPTPEHVKVAILNALGHASATKQLTTSERAQDVIHGLRECGSRVLLIDEAHHLQLTKGPRKNKDRLAGPVGDYLKLLYDAVRMAFVFLGKPSLADLFASDTQLSSRWPGPVLLSAYGLDERWEALLDSLDHALPMAERACLCETKTAERIHGFTQGIFRVLKYFLSEAVRQAAMLGATRLEDKHFAMAYYLLGFPLPNPFGDYRP